MEKCFELNFTFVNNIFNLYFHLWKDPYASLSLPFVIFITGKPLIKIYIRLYPINFMKYLFAISSINSENENSLVSV